MKLKTKPNGIFYLDTQLPDPTTGELKRTRVSLDTRDKSDAEAQRRDWLAGKHPKHPAMGGVIAKRGDTERSNGSVRLKSLDGRAMTLDRWLWHCVDTKWAKCKSLANIRSAVNVLGDYLPDVEIGDVTSTHVQQVKANLEASGKFADASIRKLLVTVGGALTYATEQENPATGRSWLAARPKMPTIQVSNIHDRVISLAEEKAVFDAVAAKRVKEPARPWWQFGMLLMVLFDTGFRLGEALSLGQRSIRVKRWRDKRTGEAKEATFLGLERYSTKNGKPREVPVTDRVLAAIPALNAQSVSGRWFPWAKGSTGAWYMWTNIRDELAEKGFDLSDVRLHTFRHTCATRLAENGMDLLGLRDWLGHGDIKVTAERYIHLMSAHLYHGVEILNLMAGTSGMTGEIGSPDEEHSTMAECLPCGTNYDTACIPTLN